MYVLVDTRSKVLKILLFSVLNCLSSQSCQSSLAIVLFSTCSSSQSSQNSYFTCSFLFLILERYLSIALLLLRLTLLPETLPKTCHNATSHIESMSLAPLLGSKMYYCTITDALPLI